LIAILCKQLKFLDGPNHFLNVHFEHLLKRLHDLSNGPDLIGQLVLFSLAIKEAIELHPMESIFLQKRFDEIDALIKAVMGCKVMDDYELFITTMCMNPFNPTDAPNIKDMLIAQPGGEYTLTSAAKTLIFTKGPISLCIKFELSALCGTAQVCSTTASPPYNYTKYS
jgi:hypothetical protein